MKGCEDCKRNKVQNKNRAPMVITPTPIQAFDRLLIDTVGPLPKTSSQHEYALTMVCDLTKYLVTIPIEDKKQKQ